MSDDDIAERLNQLSARPRPTPIVRRYFDNIHAARLRGVQFAEIAETLGVSMRALHTAYLRECSARGVEPAKGDRSAGAENSNEDETCETPPPSTFRRKPAPRSSRPPRRSG